MATSKTSQENTLKSLNIIYYALIVGQILIATILTFITSDQKTTFSWEMSNVTHLIAPILLMSCFGIGTFLYQQKLGEGKSLNGLIEKLTHYRSAIILRSALLEGANLICIVFFFLENNYFFLVLFLLGLSAFLLVRPSEEVFKENYRLNSEEKIEFQKMNDMS